MFPDLNVTSEGHRYLGSFIGTPTATSQFVVSKASDWIDDIRGITKAAHTNPQLSYSAYVFGVCKRWNFLLRTTPNIAPHLQVIEDCIAGELIPALLGMSCISAEQRQIFSLSVKRLKKEPLPGYPPFH